MQDGEPRQDGRGPADIREVRCERGLLGRADGSASWTQLGTTVLAAVYGPLEASSSKEDAERAAVEVVFKPRAGLSAPPEKLHEAVVKQVVQGVAVTSLHPRTLIQVTLQVMSDGGALLPCALNATCAALMDAGVPLKHAFAGVGVAMAAPGRFLIDPSAAEEKASQAVGSFVFAADSGEAAAQEEGMPPAALLSAHVLGAMSPDDLQDMLHVGWAAGKQLAAFHRLAAERYLAG